MAALRGIPIAVVNLGRTRADDLLTLKVEDRCEAALAFPLQPQRLKFAAKPFIRCPTRRPVNLLGINDVFAKAAPNLYGQLRDYGQRRPLVRARFLPRPIDANA